MKKSLLGLVSVLGLVAGLATAGCGSSSSSSSTSDALASCNAYCDAYGAKACADPMFASAAECKSMQCTAPPANTPAACITAAKALWDCQKAEADICADTGCDSQYAAAASACPQTP